MLFFVPAAAALVLSAARLGAAREPRTPLFIVDSVLLGLLVGMLGVGSLLAFMGHVWAADAVARSIGWPAGSPFQSEVAGANLSYAVLGLLCFRFRGGFWWAAGLGQAVFAFSAAFIHFRQIGLGDLAPGNAGATLYVADLGVPLLTLALLVARGLLARRRSQARRPTS